MEKQQRFQQPDRNTKRATATGTPGGVALITLASEGLAVADR